MAIATIYINSERNKAMLATPEEQVLIKNNIFLKSLQAQEGVRKMDKVREMLKARMKSINEALKEKGAVIQVRYTETLKNNMILCGYSLMEEGKNICPNIYFEEKWWIMSAKEMAEYLMDFYKKYKGDKVLDVNKYLNREYILSHVLPRLFGEDNVEQFKKHNRVYKNWLDMAIGYSIVIDDLSSEEGVASMPVDNEILKKADISLEELHEASITNMDKFSIIENMLDVLRLPEDAPEKMDIPPQAAEMLIVTSLSKVNGASAILCGGVIEKLKSKLGDKFYILPSSIHEVICVNADPEDEELLYMMVLDANATTVTPVDKLTDSVYKFEDGEIFKVERKKNIHASVEEGVVVNE